MQFIFFLSLLFIHSFSPSFIQGLTAKKIPKRTVASSTKGFGNSPAQALAEYLSSLPTRRPADASHIPCPCGSALLYQDCCELYHSGRQDPESPTRVLQTRYSAFCYRLIPYIMETTDPTCRDYRENKLTWAKDLHKSGMFDSFEFLGLEKGEEVLEDNNRKGRIEFQVKLKAKANGEETVVSEKSTFLCDDQGKWKYASGEVRSGVQGLEDTILNA